MEAVAPELEQLALLELRKQCSLTADLVVRLHKAKHMSAGNRRKAKAREATYCSISSSGSTRVGPWAKPCVKATTVVVCSSGCVVVVYSVGAREMGLVGVGGVLQFVLTLRTGPYRSVPLAGKIRPRADSNWRRRRAPPPQLDQQWNKKVFNLRSDALESELNYLYGPEPQCHRPPAQPSRVDMVSGQQI